MALRRPAFHYYEYTTIGDFRIFAQKLTVERDISQTLLIYPSNVTEHTDSLTLYKEKKSSGRVNLAGKHFTKTVKAATLGLPIHGIATGEIPQVAREAVLDLWRAAGFGIHLVLPVRRQTDTKYFPEHLLYRGLEYQPEFWVPSLDEANPVLAQYYLNNIKLLKAYLESPAGAEPAISAEFLTAFQEGQAARLALNQARAAHTRLPAQYAWYSTKPSEYNTYRRRRQPAQLARPVEEPASPGGERKLEFKGMEPGSIFAVTGVPGTPSATSSASSTPATPLASSPPAAAPVASPPPVDPSSPPAEVNFNPGGSGGLALLLAASPTARTPVATSTPIAGVQSGQPDATGEQKIPTSPRIKPDLNIGRTEAAAATATQPGQLEPSRKQKASKSPRPAIPPYQIIYASQEKARRWKTALAFIVGILFCWTVVAPILSYSLWLRSKRKELVQKFERTEQEQREFQDYQNGLNIPKVDHERSSKPRRQVVKPTEPGKKATGKITIFVERARAERMRQVEERRQREQRSQFKGCLPFFSPLPTLTQPLEALSDEEKAWFTSSKQQSVALTAELARAETAARAPLLGKAS